MPITIEDLDGLTLIINDHRNVDDFFTAYEQATEPDKKLRIVAKIIEDLTIHAHIEEQVLYPLVRSRLNDGEELFEHSLQEHQEAKQVLAQIEQTDVTDTQFDIKVHELIQEVRHHVEEEESDMLPRLKQAVSEEELAQLGMQLRMAKSHAPVSPSMDGDTTGDMTKDELYEKARQMDVEGRSEMTKEELARAVGDGQ